MAVAVAVAVGDEMRWPHFQFRLKLSRHAACNDGNGSLRHPNPRKHPGAPRQRAMATARKRPHMFFLATPENRQPNRKAKCAIQIQTPESGHALSPVNSSSTSETLHETESQSESGSTPVLMEAKHSLKKHSVQTVSAKNRAAFSVQPCFSVKFRVNAFATNAARSGAGRAFDEQTKPTRTPRSVQPRSSGGGPAGASAAEAEAEPEMEPCAMSRARAKS